MKIKYHERVWRDMIQNEVEVTGTAYLERETSGFVAFSYPHENGYWHVFPKPPFMLANDMRTRYTQGHSTSNRISIIHHGHNNSSYLHYYTGLLSRGMRVKDSNKTNSLRSLLVKESL